MSMSKGVLQSEASSSIWDWIEMVSRSLGGAMTSRMRGEYQFRIHLDQDGVSEKMLSSAVRLADMCLFTSEHGAVRINPT